MEIGDFYYYDLKKSVVQFSEIISEDSRRVYIFKDFVETPGKSPYSMIFAPDMPFWDGERVPSCLRKIDNELELLARISEPAGE